MNWMNDFKTPLLNNEHTTENERSKIYVVFLYDTTISDALLDGNPLSIKCKVFEKLLNV